jgi:hypothetical protein
MDWAPYVVVLGGLLNLAGVWRTRRRRLPAESAEKLAAFCYAFFFIGIGYALTPSLLGLFGAILTHSWWIALLGLPFTFVGLALIAPTRGDIERRQRELTLTGSPLSLGRALTGQPQPGEPQVDGDGA